jgi:putative oxygen-independent coproporphyrinogen III oxidase
VSAPVLLPERVASAPAAPVEHLYAHLPFCASRCGYCAFVVETGGWKRRDAYLEALLAELRREGGRIGALRTLYMGGGTPTLMRARRLEALLDALRPRLAPGAEVTVEANPETVDRRLLRALRAAGVTRLSLGVQSLQPHLLAALDRRATPEQARRAFSCARAAGFESISVDLLFAVPGQRWQDLEADLDGVLDLAPDHVSWYELELKPGSALARRPGLRLDDELAEEAYPRIVETLEGAGYRWYETANFARPGHECRHSVAYWGAADYLGVGVGAVSTHGGLRWRNEPGTARYGAALARGEAPPRGLEALDEDTRRRERWMLGTRMERPLDLVWAGPPDRPEALGRLEGLGLLRVEGGALSLTRRGRFLQNAVLNELMDFA